MVLRQRTIFGFCLILASANVVILNIPMSAKEEKSFLQAASSPSFVGTDLSYSAGHIRFVDLDGDGEQEFIGIEKASPGTLKRYASISRWTDKGRSIEWRSDGSSTIRAFLLGNLDGDPLDEMVLFGAKSENSTEDTLQIVDWEADTYKTIASTSQISGRLGALLDIDNDGVQEIALTTLNSPIPFADSDGRMPATLNVLRFSNSGLAVAYSLALPRGARALAVADLNNDGMTEILIFQSDLDFDRVARRLPKQEDGRILVYGIDPEKGFHQHTHIKMIVRSNRQREMPYLSHFGVFKCADRSYLFLETVQQRWKSIRAATTDEYGRLDLTSPNWDNIELYEFAWRSAMAYSKEHRAYAQFIDSQSFKFVPEEHIHTTFANRMCGESASLTPRNPEIE